MFQALNIRESIVIKSVAESDGKFYDVDKGILDVKKWLLENK
jgi:hypothetical protein